MSASAAPIQGSKSPTMTTLLITHPAGLNHLTPPGHPERPDRLRALTQVFDEERFQPLKRVEAPSVPLETIALCHPMDYVEALRHAVAEGRHRGDRRRHLDVARKLRGRAARGRRRRSRGRRGGRQARRQRVLRHAPARPSHRDRAADGLLPVQHRRDRGALRAGPSRARAASRSSISTCTTATARRTSSGPTPPRCIARPTRCRSIPAPARCRSAASTTPSSTRRCPPATAATGSARRSRAASCRGCATFAPELIVISAGFDAHRRDPLANLQLVEDRFRLGDEGLDGDRRQDRAGPRGFGAGRRLRSRGPVAVGRRPRHGADARMMLEVGATRSQGTNMAEKSRPEENDVRDRDRGAGIDRQAARRGQGAARGVGRDLRARRGAQDAAARNCCARPRRASRRSRSTRPASRAAPRRSM